METAMSSNSDDEFFFEDDTIEALRNDLHMTLGMLDVPLADAFEPLLQVLADAIRARPPNLRQGAIEITREAMAQLEEEN